MTVTVVISVIVGFFVGMIMLALIPTRSELAGVMIMISSVMLCVLVGIVCRLVFEWNQRRSEKANGKSRTGRGGNGDKTNP